MPVAYKVLGQIAPAATTETTLYTCPASTQTVVSTITICNRSTTTDATFRISVRPNGATLANQHYIVFDAELLAATTITITLGITVDAADVISAYASNANLSFAAFGSEIT